MSVQSGSQGDRPVGPEDASGDGRPDHAPATPRPAKIRGRLSSSAAGDTWRRLEAMDIINRAMLFAAVLFLCFLPFVIIVQAFAGRSAATSLVRRFGLNRAAAHAVSTVVASPSATSNAITGLSYVLFLLGGLAAAGAIQELYERAFDLAPRGLKDTHRRLAWLAGLLAGAALVSWAGPAVRSTGGPLLLGAVALIALTGFWWLTMWLLLGGRIAWRELLPSAIATAVFWLGMSIVFRLTMSSTITSNYAKYGAIGVMLSLMSFLIAIGVVVILGAVVGVVWRARRTNHATTGSADKSERPRTG